MNAPPSLLESLALQQPQLTRFGPNKVAADMEETDYLIFWRFIKVFGEFLKVSFAFLGPFLGQI